MSQGADEAKRVRIRPRNRGFGFTLRFCAEKTTAGDSSSRGSIVFIKSVIPNGPASVAGLSPGDRIDAVNGVRVEGRPYQEVIGWIRDCSEVLDLLVTPLAVKGELVDDTKVRIKTVPVRRPLSSDFDKKWTSTEFEMVQHRHHILSSGSSLSTEKGDSHSGSHHSRERLASYSGERLANADFSRPGYPYARHSGVRADGQVHIQSYTSVPEGLSKIPDTKKTKSQAVVSVNSGHYRDGRGKVLGSVTSQRVGRCAGNREEHSYDSEVVRREAASHTVSNVLRKRGVTSPTSSQDVDNNRVHPALDGKAIEGVQQSDYSSGSLTSHGTYSSSLSSIKLSEASSGYGTPQMPMAQTPTKESNNEGSISSGAETVVTQVSVGESREGAITSNSERRSGDGRAAEQQQEQQPWVGLAQSVSGSKGDVSDVPVPGGVGGRDDKTVSQCDESRGCENPAKQSESARSSVSLCDESVNMQARVKSDEIVVRLHSLTSPQNTSFPHRLDGQTQSMDRRRNLHLFSLQGEDERPGTNAHQNLDVSQAGNTLPGELESPAALYNETELLDMERIRSASHSSSRSQVPKNSGRNEVRATKYHGSTQRGHMLSAYVKRHEKDNLKSHYSHDDLRAGDEFQTTQLKRMQSEQSQLHTRTQSERANCEINHKLKRVKSGGTPHKRGSAMRRSATVGDQLIGKPEVPAADMQKGRKLVLSDDEHDEMSPELQGFYSSRKFQFDGHIPGDVANTLCSGSDPHMPMGVAMPYMDPVVKSGFLSRKQTVECSGKKAKDRSWKVSYYELRGHMLYAYKHEKEAKQPENFEEQPVSVKSCRVDIAYDYLKRPYTFRFTAYNGSEFLFQTASREGMMEWIEGIRSHSNPDDDLDNKVQADLILRKAVEQRQRRNRRSPVRSTSGSRLGKENSNKDLSDGAAGMQVVSNSRRPLFGRKISGGQHDMQREDEEFNGFFKKSLSECEMSNVYKDVPLIVVRCVEEVEKRGIDVEGIYRVSGNTSEVRLLMDAIQRDLTATSFIDERWQGIHNVTSLLKLFLRELGQPIFPKDMYDNFMSASKVEDEDHRLIMLKQLIQELPPLNFSTLRFLTRHLHHVASKAELSNKMYAKNLAIVFGPTLVRREVSDMEHIMSDMGNQCNIVERLIVHCDWFFGSSQGEERKPRPFVRPSRSRDFLVSDFAAVSQAVNGDVTDGSSPGSVHRAAPRKPRRTMEYNPADPDDGTEGSDFWQRYPPSEQQQDAHFRVSPAARMDATTQWLQQMAAQAWRRESGSSSPASFRKPQQEGMPSDGSGSHEHVERRSSQTSIRSLGGSYHSVGYQRALQALQAAKARNGGGKVVDSERPEESNSNQNAAHGVVRRERRGRRNWRGAKVTDSGDLSGENINFQSSDWSRFDSIGKVEVGRSARRHSHGRGRASSETRVAAVEADMRTTLL